MARLYRTTSANPMDYFYQIPDNMMMKVLETNENMIDNTVNTIDLYNNAVLKIPHLSQHNDFVTKRQQYYNEKTEGIAKSLMENPMEWRRKLPLIKDIGRELQQDMSTGELSRVSSNYNRVMDFKKSHEERLKKGDITQADYDFMTNRMLSDYKGVDANGRVQDIALDNITNSYNLPEYMDNLVSKMQDDGQLSKSANFNDMYKIVRERGWEGLKEDKVFGTLYNKMMGDPNFWASVNQRAKYEVPGYSGIYNDQGKLNLFQTQEGIPVPADNALSRAFFGAVKGKTHMKTRDLSDADFNQNYLQERRFANERERDLQKHNWSLEKEDRDNMADLGKALMRSKDPLDRKRGEAILSGVDTELTGLYRGNEQVFTVDELQPKLESYLNILYSDKMGPNEKKDALNYYKGMFGNYLDKHNLSIEQLGDVIAVQKGDLSKFIKGYRPTGSRDGGGQEPVYDKRYTEALSNIKKIESTKETGKSIIQDLASNIERPTNPSMFIDPNTNIGQQSIQNIGRSMAMPGNVSIYSEGQSHRKDGNLEPSKAPQVEIGKPGSLNDIETDIYSAAKQIANQKGIPLSQVIKFKSQRPEGNSLVVDAELVLPEGYEMKDGSKNFKMVLKRGAENLLPLLNSSKLKNLKGNPDYEDFRRTFNPNFRDESILDDKFSLVQAGLQSSSGKYEGRNYKIDRTPQGGFTVNVDGIDYGSIGGNPITSLEQIKAVFKYLSSNNQ